MFFKCSNEKNLLPHCLSTWQPFKYLKIVIIFTNSSFQATHTLIILSKVQNCHWKRYLWHILKLENTRGNAIVGSTELSKQQIFCRGLCNFYNKMYFLNRPRKIHIFTWFSLNYLTYHETCCEIFSLKSVYITFAWTGELRCTSKYYLGIFEEMC